MLNASYHPNIRYSSFHVLFMCFFFVWFGFCFSFFGLHQGFAKGVSTPSSSFRRFHRRGFHERFHGGFCQRDDPLLRPLFLCVSHFLLCFFVIVFKLLFLFVCVLFRKRAPTSYVVSFVRNPRLDIDVCLRHVGIDVAEGFLWILVIIVKVSFCFVKTE